MATDPGLNADNCIFLEANPGDSGMHDPNNFWLSNDLIVVGSPSGRVGTGTTTVRATVRRKNNCTLTNGGDGVLVEAYVCVPGPVINPADANQAFLLGTNFVNVPMNTHQASDFTFTATTNPAQPQGTGHKCLIARAYPDDLTPDSANVEYARDDPHYTQHNICIIECGAPGAARAAGPCGFEAATANPDAKAAQAVTLQLAADLQPSKAVLDALLPRLKQMPSFKRLVTRAPAGIDMQFPDFPGAKLRHEKVGCLGRLLFKTAAPVAKVDLNLKPAQMTRFTLSADLAGSSFGDAHIFHLTQYGSKGGLQGGLTLAMIVV